MNTAKPNCLLAVQHEHGLLLDSHCRFFHGYINAAVLIAHKVQTTYVAEAEPAAAKTWAQTAAADTKPRSARLLPLLTAHTVQTTSLVDPEVE